MVYLLRRLYGVDPPGIKHNLTV